MFFIRIAGLLSLLAVSFAVGRFSAPADDPAAGAAPPLPVAAEDSERNEVAAYRFISPLLQCENATPLRFQKIIKTETAVGSVIDEAKKRGDITMASVYFRDLNNGPWFGRHEKEPFIPASLLKVPLMITYLRAAEHDPSALDRKILFDGAEYPMPQAFMFGEPLKRGRSYSVRELMERMIRNSDNTAMVLLTSGDYLSFDQLESVYKGFGIESPVNPGYQINAVTYASFFRVLYNATYVSRDLSEYALELMSQSAFNDGLRAGIPEEVVVSHKFGERISQTGERQLHDCGIVYAPGKPYLVCIMTRGSDFKRLSSVIAELSKQVYSLTTSH